MSFDQFNLHPILQRNLALIGYETPRPIQQHVIEPMLEGRDIIGLAKTGTGKTAAFVVPMAQQLIAARPPQRKGRPIEPGTRLRGLIIAPTRELAQQIAAEASQICQGSVLRVEVAYGKVAISPQIRAIARGIDLLVATPGRLRELIDADAISLEHVRHVTIDEADRMLDMGFLPQVRSILNSIPSGRQISLFTATMPKEVEQLAREFLNDPVRVESDPHTTPVEHVTQRLLPVHDDDKVALLLHLLQKSNLRGVLVFCRTKRRVGWVAGALQRNDIGVGMLHGDRSQMQRQKSLDRFANRELRVLVATDVAARGLHVTAVKTVINYDLPLTPEEYVHRIGRAAHGGGHGEAITFLSDDREERMRWRAILNKLKIEVFAEEIEGFEPTRRVQRKARREGRGAERENATRTISNRALRRQAREPRRSKKGRPIKKGQKPGGGVRRPN